MLAALRGVAPARAQRPRPALRVTAWVSHPSKGSNTRPPRRVPSHRANAKGDWPAPAPVVGPPGLSVATTTHHDEDHHSSRALDATTRTLQDERRDIASKAKQLMNIDPNDPHALDAIGSNVPCHVQFRVPYDTAHGEDLFIIGSHEKLGAWNQHKALPMSWGEGGNWWANVDLPAGGVFFYKYAVRGLDGAYNWQEGANNLLVLPDEWDIPEDSLFVVDDNFAGLSRSSQNMLATKVISYEKEIVQLRMEAVKAKEMTKASLQELLVTREELEEANLKLSQYESNVQAVFDSMNTGSQSHAR